MGKQELYDHFQDHSQPAGHLLTVEGAEELELRGFPWPISGDLTVTRPVRLPTRHLSALDDVLDVAGGDLSVHAWLNRWLLAEEESAQEEGGLSASAPIGRDELRNTPEGRSVLYQRNRRQQVTKYLVPTIGSIPLSQLNRADVERLADSLQATEGTHGILSRSTVRSVLAHLKKALAAARQRGMIEANPAAGYIHLLNGNKAAA